MVEPSRIALKSARPIRVTRVSQAQLSSLQRRNSQTSGLSSSFNEFHEHNARNQQFKVNENGQRRILTASDRLPRNRFYDKDTRTISSFNMTRSCHFNFDDVHRPHLHSLHRSKKTNIPRIASIQV